MPSFNVRTPNDLKKVLGYIEKQTMSAMQDDVARMVYDTIQKYLLSTVYANKHYEYERTYQLLRALTVGKATNKGGNIEVSIYIDSDKITANSSTNTKWNEHAYMGGEDFSEYLPWVLEEGTKSPIPSPYYDNTKGFEYMKQSRKEILDQQKHIKALIGYLRSKGINASVG